MTSSIHSKRTTLISSVRAIGLRSSHNPSGSQQFHYSSDDECDKYVPFCMDDVRLGGKCPGFYDKDLQSTALVTLSRSCRLGRYGFSLMHMSHSAERR